MSVTVVITACNRPDLLKRTIQSFLAHNTYPIEEWIISEDSGDPHVNHELQEMYPSFRWICPSTKRGQIRSIDEAYSYVKTPYVFHLEDDWETYKDGAIRESIRILETTPNVSAVMCREHTKRVYYMSDTPPYLSCWGGWGYFSFNPGLRRMSDYKDLFLSSYANATNADGVIAERTINDMFRENRYRMALTPDPAGYIRHIGEGRHVFRIGLCMIVKNEAHILHESLRKVRPLIDTYCIVDTGSTDNTLDVIRDVCQDLGLEGHVHQRPWKNFGHNRSEALALCDGHMDYILMMDADDLIEWSGDGRTQLQAVLQTRPSSVRFEIRQGTLTYTRLQMFQANDGWKYVGVLHEYPTNGKPLRTADCPSGMYMVSRRLGGRNQVPDKMKRDIAVLLQGIRDEPNNERYVFYLAQSYRDDGQTDEAIKWYTKRYEMGGWFEERYVSAYNVAKLTHSKEWAWKAHQCNPKRIECLVSYMSHCRLTNQFSRELLAMAMYASTIPKPSNQLFLENDVYDWKVWDELALIAWYCGEKEIAKHASTTLQSKQIPLDQCVRIAKNHSFMA